MGSLLVKILGAIDVASAFAFLMLVFGITPLTQYMVFCAGLLLLKGLFILGGDVLSIIDIGSSICLFLSIFFALPPVFLWMPAFLLIAKGLVSFI